MCTNYNWMGYNVYLNLRLQMKIKNFTRKLYCMLYTFSEKVTIGNWNRIGSELFRETYYVGAGEGVCVSSGGKSAKSIAQHTRGSGDKTKYIKMSII